jgi:CopG family nickel-responsive transcriptional regulator
MVIVSISLNDTVLKEIDRIQNTFGYSGRSEVIRAGVRLLISESKEIDKIMGNINSILLLVHSQEMEDVVTEIKHKFEDITNTQIHSHLRENNCLEVFVLEGNADRIKEMVRLFQTNRKIEYAKLIVA